MGLTIDQQRIAERVDETWRKLVALFGAALDLDLFVDADWFTPSDATRLASLEWFTLRSHHRTIAQLRAVRDFDGLVLCAQTNEQWAARLQQTIHMALDARGAA